MTGCALVELIDGWDVQLWTNWLSMSLEMTLRLFSSATFYPLSAVEKAIALRKEARQNTHPDDADDMFHSSKDPFWRNHWNRGTYDVDALRASMRYMERLGKAYFAPNGTLRDWFHTHSEEHETNFVKFQKEVMEQFRKVDDNPRNTLRPAARFLFVSYRRSLDKSVALIPFIPTLANNAHKSLIEAGPSLSEVSEHATETRSTCVDCVEDKGPNRFYRLGCGSIHCLSCSGRRAVTARTGCGTLGTACTKG